MQVEIYSEIAPLKSVILHKPGEEHFFINPNNLNEWIPGNNKLINNPDYLLFDDLINPQKAMEEHNLLSQVIKKITGNNNCIEFTDLVLDILNDKELKKSLLIECLNFENKTYGTNISKAKMLNLFSMENNEILLILLTGCNPNNKKEIYFKHPIPNLIFSRDIASVIGKTILLTWGRRKVRNRENIIAKHVFLYHEIFTDIKTYDFNEKHPTLSIEGGDIIILNEETVCIGMSERTTDQAINAILPLFFNEGFKNIYAIDLPKHRSIMHLDTIFNRINNHEAVVFPPFFSDNPNDQNILTIYCISKGEKLNNCKTSKENLLKVLQDCNIQLNPIQCGGNDRLNQVREQWTDGANYFTLSPGIIIGYDCNFNTIIELQNAGYECIDAKKFLMQKSLNKQSKLMISIPSSELSRGRGGARCLTLPLSRAKNNG